MKNTRNLLSATAFATAAAPAKGKAGAPKAEDRIAPEFTAISTAIPIPASVRAGGRRSELVVKLGELPVNGSIGLKNKTKKQISATISKLNNSKENLVQRKNEDGSLATKNGDPIKDQSGTVVGYQQVPDMEKVKEFVAHDVDPKSDADNATVRIWRTK